MRVRLGPPVTRLACLLFVVWQASRCTAASDIAIDATLFDNLPSRVVYFDDTTTVLLHDSVARNTWRSTDEGKTWAPVDGVPLGESWNIVEHPYDTTIAFILSKGTTHYRTLNRGQLWQSFETPSPPALTSQALAFHSQEWEWIMYTGQVCPKGASSGDCYDEVYYTQDAFNTSPRKLIDNVSRCLWAHSTKYVAPSIPNELLYCIAFEPPSPDRPASGGMRSLRESRLYSSHDFFKSETTFVDFGVGKEARGLVGIGTVKGFLVAALKPQGDTDGSASDQMVLYVTLDGTSWSRVIFPHGHGLRENAYTIVDSTKHSIMVDVLSDQGGISGTLFTSNSNGTYMTRSLERTNRNDAGIVDFESLENIDGVAIANTVLNADEVEGRNENKQLKTMISFDDGGEWHHLRAPSRDISGDKFRCDVSDPQSCSLNLHSVTQLHNYGRVFSSPAPGIVMAVGSVGRYLLPYEDCDTFLSTDAGLTWSMVAEGAHKYEFGDQGSILVLLDDEEPTDILRYSTDFGKTWKEKDMGVTMRVRVLTTIPDSTSLKFLALGTLSRKSKKGDEGERHVAVRIDFADMGLRQCGEGDKEKWYARALGGSPDCLMGHKLWFTRRKADADCFVMEKFKDPVGQEENCECSREDFECDYNYVPDKGECVLAGPQPIPAGSCLRDDDQFMGSSGYRKIPGDTCIGGMQLDQPKMKDCKEGQAAPGEVSHKISHFPSRVLDQAYFGDSRTLLAFCEDRTVWQSDNEGFAWDQVLPNEQIVTMTMHPYRRDRAYLLTAGKTVHYTNNKGKNWRRFEAPLPPNILGLPILDFHPTRPDWLIFTGSEDCTDPLSAKCKSVTYYTKDGGGAGSWHKLLDHARVCTWARDTRFKVDERTILCESYPNKEVSPRMQEGQPVELLISSDYFSSSRLLFSNVIGMATVEEYLVVAVLDPESGNLSLQASLNGQDFAESRFPPNLRLATSAYTVLESTTDAIFLHVTTHGAAGSEWGSLFKSNSNGTYYALSLEHVNRNSRGFVDFEKMLGLDGIAVMNVVGNPDEASITGNKHLQTRITHNDGGRWKPIAPPQRDHLGKSYECSSTGCSLQLHGYTERTDPRATYSSPSAVGLMLGVGNVGVSLAPYTESDTFLTRDAGFTWEEVHKDAHMWEFGDQGSILLLVNDEQPTDRVSYSLDEGSTWKDYVFGEMIRARSIVTVPKDTSRRFIIMGFLPNKQDSTVAVHLDFSKVTNVKCKLDVTDANNDDFELWSPSEQRVEQCLFGKQTKYYRRIRDRNCYIGEEIRQPHKIERHCSCTEEDFECEFNYRRDSNGKCVLVDGAEPLANEPNCAWGQTFWYERTNMRKAAGHGFIWWIIVLGAPFGMAALFATWWTKRRGGRIRLGDSAIQNGGYLAPSLSQQTGLGATLASVPYWLLGLANALTAKASGMFGGRLPGQRGGYRSLAVDDDAEELLHDWGDDE